MRTARRPAPARTAASPRATHPPPSMSRLNSPPYSAGHARKPRTTFQDVTAADGSRCRTALMASITLSHTLAAHIELYRLDRFQGQCPGKMLKDVTRQTSNRIIIQYLRAPIGVPTPCRFTHNDARSADQRLPGEPRRARYACIIR
jgi:hypothetical protein